MYHKSVLLSSVIDNLNIHSDGVYVDATLGYAGHSSEILKRIPKGFLYGIDQDSYAIAKSDEILSSIGNNYKIFKSNFSNITRLLGDLGVDKVDGILFDLGVSSVQLDDGDRGFSYNKNSRLDMRMDRSVSFSAYDVVNNYEYRDLVRIFRDYGEEMYATSIARGIVNNRVSHKIETTFELSDIIKKSIPSKAMRDHHPARRVFQAIRIEVNDELNVLKDALEQALKLIDVGGRVCVISFHSLEDKIVKDIFNKYSNVSSDMKKLPFVPSSYLPKYRIVSKGITPSEEEVKDNNRARSARLRVIERVRM